jgi:hypothetical protein
MVEIKQFEVFILSKDINPNITQGMRGVVLEIWTKNDFEVEFVKDDGTNYDFDGHFTFTIDKSYIEKLFYWKTVCYKLSNDNA